MLFLSMELRTMKKSNTVNTKEQIEMRITIHRYGSKPISVNIVDNELKAKIGEMVTDNTYNGKISI